MAPLAAASCQDVTLPVIPELHDASFLDALLPVRDVPMVPKVDEPRHPMMDALKAAANRTRTTNGDPAFASTLSPTLDAFQALRPGWFDPDLGTTLSKAWDEDPELTLRIIWNCRSIHDGKSDKEVFYQAFGWLFKNHPRTAITNLSKLVEPVCKIGKREKTAPHGYWKDLLNIVALAITDQLGPRAGPAPFLHSTKPWEGRPGDKIKRTMEEQARLARKRWVAKNAGFHAAVVEALKEPSIRALYVAVARLFAAQLVKDIDLARKAESMPPGDERRDILYQISLAGKWAPTPGGSHDRVTNLCTAISELIYYDPSYPDRPTLSISRDTPIPTLDTHVLRSFYQRWFLSPLRKVISCPEPLMSANRWSDINYRHVPSVCMHRNLPHFYKHDTTRFESYLEDVESGKSKISGATLLPHQLLMEAVRCSADARHTPDPAAPSIKDFRKRLAETKLRGVDAQWKTMVERVREAATLDNCLAVCDVSGSMGSVFHPSAPVAPIFPAVALALLLAELAAPPFAHTFVTFSAQPQVVALDAGAPLLARLETAARADWGMNTAFDRVFLDLLLPLALAHKVPREGMVRRLFVFSDMQFDEARDSARGSAWDTTHDAAARAFAAAGYDLPEIVYWNLAAGPTTHPAGAERAGVALVSGWSPALLKVFMGEAEEDAEDFEMVDADPVRKTQAQMDPVGVMVKAVSKASFDGLVVVD
ncbi:vWFA domain-containing protein [Phanerochaete sordida]|uniref:VWFA domain-containing protein n=1 Tax=Phanerochaete sordida TaxID=48140 RepID=A0A9P3GN79_9APHY|nr:vWFA domain-containing protein [Phanerochaete sordida]